MISVKKGIQLSETFSSQICKMKTSKKNFSKKTVEPDKALAIAINIEMGTLNQLKMNANKTELNSTVNQVQRMRIANTTPFLL